MPWNTDGKMSETKLVLNLTHLEAFSMIKSLSVHEQIFLIYLIYLEPWSKVINL